MPTVMDSSSELYALILLSGFFGEDKVSNESDIMKQYM